MRLSTADTPISRLTPVGMVTHRWPGAGGKEETKQQYFIAINIALVLQLCVPYPPQDTQTETGPVADLLR